MKPNIDATPCTETYNLEFTFKVLTVPALLLPTYNDASAHAALLKIKSAVRAETNIIA